MSVHGKNVYKSKSEARRSAKAQKRCGRLNGTKLRIYWCDECNGYHLTSWAKKDVR